MIKHCSVCGAPFRDRDEIVVAMRSRFHLIASAKTYSIENPYECLDLKHEDCWTGGA